VYTYSQARFTSITFCSHIYIQTVMKINGNAGVPNDGNASELAIIVYHFSIFYWKQSSDI
jgi:hypothetical protein